MLLQVEPHVGDTLRMRLEQQTEMTGDRGPEGDATAGDRPRDVDEQHERACSRAVVESRRGGVDDVVAITDSVHPVDVRRACDGRRRRRRASDCAGSSVRFRSAPDGTVSMSASARDGSCRARSSQVVSLMPADLSATGGDRVGEKWMREMPLPPAAQLGAQALGTGARRPFASIRSTHGGKCAFVSMRGEMLPDRPRRARRRSRRSRTAPSTADARRPARGWLTESRFIVIVRSLVTPPPAIGVSRSRCTSKSR